MMKRKNEKGHGRYFKPIPGNNPVLIPDTTIDPYYYVGLLEMTFPNDKSYFGTATLIAADKNATNSKYLLTCAHNLYDEDDGGEVRTVTFKRAYSDPNEPYGELLALSWHYPDGYPDVAISKNADLQTISLLKIMENIDLDYAIVELESAVEIAGFPTIVVESTESLENLEIQINGYGYFDERMGHATGTIDEVGTNFLRYGITTDQGASGSALMKNDNRSIVGIHTRAVPNKDLNQGVRITEAVNTQLRGWMV
ncbi:MAG: hypothetical protein HKN09_05800 [Saprospiraceae bacterium]|nr:hypothetical protein [Saprospiraceae bacterium]